MSWCSWTHCQLRIWPLSLMGMKLQRIPFSLYTKEKVFICISFIIAVLLQSLKKKALDKIYVYSVTSSSTLPISLSSLQILLVQISGSWKDRWTLEKLTLPGNILLVSINLCVIALLGMGFFNQFLSSSKINPWWLLKISTAEKTVNVKYISLFLFSNSKLVIRVYEYDIWKA